jgi:oxygen-independent coproporphyrinogen-3 oxidase
MEELSSPGIYLHVPFCRTKCPYCDFYSVADISRGETLPDAVKRFFAAVESEAWIRSQELPGPAGTLYVGGGTPSAVDPRLVSSLPGALSGSMGLEEGAEVTIEVNPDDITQASAAEYLGGGFNRISIGVQSFDDTELEYLGRRHDSAAARAAVETAKTAGFDRIGIDLIFGLAGQTIASLRKSVEAGLQYEPQHISCYQLTVEPGTPMGMRKTLGEEVTAPEEVQREMYLEVSAVLEERGYIHYEVSNFALGEENRSRHNLGYWLRRPYVGLGPSAHSFDGTARSWNDGSLEEYLAAVEREERPAAGEERLSAEQVRVERLMLGFRTSQGVEIDLLRESPRFSEIMEELLEIPLVRIAGDRVAPTAEGYLVADQLPLLFL